MRDIESEKKWERLLQIREGSLIAFPQPQRFKRTWLSQKAARMDKAGSGELRYEDASTPDSDKVA
jgi:hypothetical protein